MDLIFFSIILNLPIALNMFLIHEILLWFLDLSLILFTTTFFIIKLIPHTIIAPPQFFASQSISLLLCLRLHFQFFSSISVSNFCFFNVQMQSLVSFVIFSLTLCLSAADLQIFALSVGEITLKILFLLILLFISVTWSLLSLRFVIGTKSLLNLGAELNSKLGPASFLNRIGVSLGLQMCLCIGVWHLLFE